MVVDVGTRTLMYHQCKKCRRKVQKVPERLKRSHTGLPKSSGSSHAPAVPVGTSVPRYSCSKCQVELDGLEDEGGEHGLISHYMLQVTVMLAQSVESPLITCLIFTEVAEPLIGCPPGDFYKVCVYQPEAAAMLKRRLLGHWFEVRFKDAPQANNDRADGLKKDPVVIYMKPVTGYKALFNSK